MTGKFVVIEGLDATGKSTLVEELVKRLNATQLACPPELKALGLSDGDLRSHFDNRPPVYRRAYYRAANLIASEQTEIALQNGHVVMDRYWPSTVAFAALDDDSDLDQEWQGRYPPELHEPDAVILLTVDEENRKRRMCKRGEPHTDVVKPCFRHIECSSLLRLIPAISIPMAYLKLHSWLCTSPASLSEHTDVVRHGKDDTDKRKGVSLVFKMVLARVFCP